MAYENFIPTVWAEAINRELEKALVYAEGCNRQYDGEVKAMGDTVRILGVGRPTITTTTDKAITLSAPESVEDSSVTLAVRQISYFNYKVDDIDKRQAVGGVMEALNKEATYGLADEMDKHIAGMAATREAVKYAASATAITKDNKLLILHTMSYSSSSSNHCQPDLYSLKVQDKQFSAPPHFSIIEAIFT